MQGAQGNLVGKKQGEQASAEAVADVGHQVEGAAQRRPSPLQVPLPSIIASSLSYVRNTQSQWLSWVAAGWHQFTSQRCISHVGCHACILSYIPASARPDVHAEVWQMQAIISSICS